MDLGLPARLQICSHKRKSAMSERRQIDKRIVLVTQFHPTGGFIGKTHISQGSVVWEYRTGSKTD